MKLTKTEKCAILLTALMLVFSAGFFAAERGDTARLYIGPADTEKPPDGTVGVKYGSEPYLNEALTPVNINTAGAEQLMELDGIGEKLAGRIIAYREKNGDFERPADITLVPGIGDGIYSRICADITV